MSNKINFPIPLLILDVFGTLLLAVGLYGLIGEENLVTPYALFLIVLGGLMMLPLIVFFITRIGKSN